MSDDTTIVLSDLEEVLKKTDNEASDQPACLVVVGGELNGTIFDLTDKSMQAGRSPDNAIALELNGISRHHFEINLKEDGFYLKDLGSKNGTFLNNQKLERDERLRKGDVIKIGAIALKFIPPGDPERLTYDKLSKDANIDKHTGCFNKDYFNKSLDQHYKKSKVTGEPLSLIIFDLDHFKKLNDNYGHDAGDYVLKEMAQIIRDSGSREDDVFARYGGEEFVILLPKTNLKNAFEIAERVRALVEAHKFIYSEQRLPVTASIGVADYRSGVNSGLDLFKRADKAVYKAKESGRNQVQFYRPE